MNTDVCFAHPLTVFASLGGRADSYLWHAHGTFELSGAKFKNLSPALLSEINIYLHRDMVQKVPFFATCSSAVVQAVVQRLVPEVYLEGDFVIHHADVNSAMYFITRGECGVLIPEPGRANVLRKIKTLSREDYFGEVRTARWNVRAPPTRAPCSTASLDGLT